MTITDEMKKLIDRSLIFGSAIQIGNLRINTSGPAKHADPDSPRHIIFLTIKNDDGAYEGFSFGLPKSIEDEVDILISASLKVLSAFEKGKTWENRLKNLKDTLHLLIWLGEHLTGEKAELIEVEDV